VSVRGEYRRLGGELLAALGAAGDASADPRCASLAAQLERASDDLAGAAEGTAALLPGIRALAPSDTEARRSFDDAYERLEAVCRIILGR